MKGNLQKENEDPDFVKNPYQAIVMARDSLKQREETKKMQAEMHKLDNEVNEMRLKNEEEKVAIQDLELALIKRRRKAEKCRRLAEAQSSYRSMLEKMIRDTMHQSVIYKEQVRLNQAASNALMARLEAQREICDAAEKELHKKYKQRDDMEKQIRPEWEQGRKRFRTDDSTIEEERGRKPVLHLPGMRPRTPFHKELRVLMEEEEQRVPDDDGLSENEEQKQEEKEEELAANNNDTEEKLEEHTRSLVALDEAKTEERGTYSIDQKLEISEGKRNCGYSFSSLHETKVEEDEETRKQRGKGNVEKWLHMLLENCPQETFGNASGDGTEDIIQQLNQKFPQKELKVSKVSNSDYIEKQQLQLLQDKVSYTDKEVKREKNYSTEACIGDANDTPDFEGMEKRKEEHKNLRRLVRSESARALRRIPSAPSLLQGMRSSIKTIKKAVKL